MVCEALEIKRATGDPKLEVMNGKLEYNRTVLPDIEDVQMTEEEKKEEEELWREIEKLKKERRRGYRKTSKENEGRPRGD